MARDIHVGTCRLPQSGHLSRTRPLGQGTRQERVTDTPFTFLKIVKFNRKPKVDQSVERIKIEFFEN